MFFYFYSLFYFLKGYLTSTLSLKYDLNVIGFERNKKISDSAIERMKSKKKTKKKKKLKFIKNKEIIRSFGRNYNHTTSVKYLDYRIDPKMDSKKFEEMLIQQFDSKNFILTGSKFILFYFILFIYLFIYLF